LTKAALPSSFQIEAF